MKCAACGGSATKLNAKKIPVCARHAKKDVSAPSCGECGAPMSLRQGKFGAFWGCQAYPNCLGTQKI